MMLNATNFRTTGSEAVGDAMRPSAVDRLVDNIRELVRDRGLGIGDQLPTERELSEMYQAGRNTVREALQILKAYGIVEVRPKVGAVLSGQHQNAMSRVFTFQNEISPASFMDVQGYRKIVEIGVGDHVILNATAEELDRLEEINDQFRDVLSVEQSARADFEFHEAIVALSGNRTLLANYQLLQSVITQIMRVGKSIRPAQVNTHETHLEIVKALRAKDRVAYAYLLGRHLEYGLQFVNTEVRTLDPAA